MLADPPTYYPTAAFRLIKKVPRVMPDLCLKGLRAYIALLVSHKIVSQPGLAELKHFGGEGCFWHAD